MKEKELRLTLVCYGGVSLAVYMHGVTREILKLVRASRLYHLDAARERREQASYQELDDVPGRETDTENVYFEFLKQLGPSLDLRIFVDTITGSSAGGINGVLLARALAHNLSIDQHRDMWLECADVTALMDESTKAGPWSKIFMKPLFWDMSRRWLDRFAPDAEARAKLDLFTRSRWFSPPFSGDLMSAMLLDAFEAMGPEPYPGASLLPIGHKLDLIVSATDYYGYGERLALHDPAEVIEREHRHSLRFSYRQSLDGKIASDFRDENVPGLVFAGRATSSFPGAFPPAQIKEMDRVLKDREQSWPAREAFLKRNFAALSDAGIDPVSASFIDGSVVNNKPFGEAVASARGRFAYREVDRRIVYIDPDPQLGIERPNEAPPGFFNTIRGALSDIPRNEPVREQLQSIGDLANRAHRYHQVVNAARDHVVTRVRDMLGDERRAIMPGAEELESWRDLANTRAAKESGYAFEGYVQLKVLSVIEAIGDTIADIAGVGAHPRKRREVTAAVEAWAVARGIFPVEWSEDQERTLRESGAPWVDFLRHYDASFRVRRVRFVIRRLNEIYALAPIEGPNDAHHGLDVCKQALYEALAQLEQRIESDIIADHCGALARRACAGDTVHTAQLSDLMDELVPAMDLTAADAEIDRRFAVMTTAPLTDEMRLQLAHAYIGFPFFDVLTFPMLRWNELDDVEELLVDRISPEDARTLRPQAGKTVLRGRDLGRFAAFFSRAARENDYLWGRLHGADRLVDLICSTAGACLTDACIDPLAMKARLFRAILEAERPHLTNVHGLISELEAEVVGMGHHLVW